MESVPQHPKRPDGFYEDFMIQVRIAATRAGLTNEEQVTVFSMYAGLAVARLDISVEFQLEALAHASQTMNASCLSRTAVKQGKGLPVKPNRMGSI